MSKNNIKTSGFCLAKRKELTGDDFYEIKQLCDGVGSAQEGAMAAKKVTQHIINNFKNIPKVWSIEKAMKEFITSINSILYAQSIHEYERPEYVTTVSVCVIKGNRLYGANAGDSRIYLLRDNKLSVKVLEVQDSWFGVTYKEDAPVVKESFKKLIDEGVYSSNLFDNIK